MHKHHKTALAAFAMASALTAGLPAAGQSAAPTQDLSAVPDNTREGFRDRMRERMRERMTERDQSVDRKLTPEQVRDIVEGRLALSSNPNLKVGKVSPKDGGVVSVDIVTKTGALVATRNISTRTGGPAQAEARREGRPAGQMRGGSQPGRAAMGEDFMKNTSSRDLNLTIDQARKLAEARLIMLGNPNLKVGTVKEKNAETITIDIVAADNSLVVQQEINRNTGRRKRS